MAEIDLGKAEGRLYLDTSQFADALKSAITDLGGFENKSESVWGNVTKIAAGAGAAIMGSVGAMSAFVAGVGSDFESEMSNITGITGMAVDEISAMGSGIRGIATDTGKSVLELAANAKMVAEAGGDMGLMMEQMSHGTNLAIATQTNMATTLDFLGSAMKTFGLEAEDTQASVDSLAGLTTIANLELSQIAESFKNGGSSAKNAGLDISDFNAFLAVFSEGIGKGGTAGTQFAAVLDDLSTPTDTAKEELKRLNIELYNLDGSSRNMYDIMRELESALKDMSDEERNAAESVIFSETAIGAWNDIAKTGVENIVEISEELRNGSEAFEGVGQAAGMAAAVVDNLQGDMSKFKSMLESLGIQVYESFRDPLRESVQAGTTAIGELQNELAKPKMLESIKGITKGFSELLEFLLNIAVTVIPLLVSAAAGLITTVSSLINGFETFAPVIIGVTTAFAGYKVISAWSESVKEVTDIVDKAKESNASLITAFSESAVAKTAEEAATTKAAAATAEAAAATAEAAVIKANETAVIKANELAKKQAALASTQIKLAEAEEAVMAAKATAATEGQTAAYYKNLAATQTGAAASKSLTLSKQAEEAAAKASALSYTLEEKAIIQSNAVKALQVQTTAASAAANQANLAVIHADTAASQANSAAKAANTLAQNANTVSLTLGQAFIAMATQKMTLHTFATQLATAVTKAFGVAWKVASGPVGIATAIIGVLALGIAALVNHLNKETEAQKETKRSAEELAEAHGRLTDSIKSSKEAYDGKIKSIEADAVVSSDLADRIDELSAKENKSIEDKQRLAILINQLNESMGGTLLLYDEENDKLTETEGSIRKLIEARQAEAMAQAAKERMVELAKQQLDLEEQTEKAHKLYLKSLGDGSTRDVIMQLKDEYESLKGQSKEAGESYQKYSELVVEYSLKQTDAVTEGTKKRTAVMNEEARTASDVQKGQERIADENTKREENQTLKLTEEANKRNLLLKDYEKLLEEQTKVLENYTSAATEMFKELSDESELSIGDMTENLERNREVVERLGDNFLALEGKIDEGLLQTLKNAGVDSAATVNELANSTEKELEAFNKAYADSAGTAMDTWLEQFKSPEVANAGSDLVDANAKGIEENESMKSAMSDMVDNVRKTADEQVKKNNFFEVGENIAMGAAWGVEKKTPTLISSLQAMLQKGLTVSQEEIDSHSPSRKFAELIGWPIAEGVAVGIKEKAHLVEKAVTEMTKSAYEEAKKYVELYQQDTNYSISEEIKMMEMLAAENEDNVDRQIEIQKRLKILREDEQKEAEKAVNARVKAEKEAYDYQKLLIKDYQNQLGYSIQEEIKKWEKLLEEHKGNLERKVEIQKNINDLLAKADKESSDAEKEAEKKAEENEKKALQAKKDKFNEEKKLIQDQTDFKLLSLTQQYVEWKKIQDLYAEGTEYRMEIDKQLFKLEEQLTSERKTLNDKIIDLNQEYTNAEKARTQEILSTISTTVDLQQREEDLGKSHEDLTEKVKSLTKEKKDLWEQWRKGGDTVEETTELFKKYIEKSNELVDTTKELKTVEEESSKSRATVLIENLKSQVDELEKWAGDVQKLSETAIDKGLLAELQKMGPGASGEIAALVNMTEDELTEYSDLYLRAQQLANAQAINELGGLKEKIEGKITGITEELAGLELPKDIQLGTKIADNIIEGVDGKSAELDNAVQKLADDTAGKFDSAFGSAAENVGSFVGVIIDDIQLVKTTTSDVTNSVPQMFRNMASEVKAQYSGMWTWIGQSTKSVVSQVLDDIASVKTAVDNMLKDVKESIDNSIKEILTMLEDYREDWRQMGADYADAFAEGADFQKFLDKVKQAIQDSMAALAEAGESTKEQLVWSAKQNKWVTEAEYDSEKRSSLAQSALTGGSFNVTINSPKAVDPVEATHVWEDEKKKVGV